MMMIGSFLSLTECLLAAPSDKSRIAGGVQVTYLGHPAFKLVSTQGVTIYIDPFLSGNPSTPPEMKAVDKADLVLITHGHADHVGDALMIAQKTGARIVAIPELARYLTRKGALDVVGMNKGGTYVSHGVAITMVNAFHSSSVTENDQVIYTGEPAGYVVKFENGFTLYHAGDTCVFGDMKIIGDIYQPELAILPIGGHYTMDPREAVYACRLLGAKYAIPMHYGTSPVLTGTAEEFVGLMKDLPRTKAVVLKPGETWL